VFNKGWNITGEIRTVFADTNNEWRTLSGRIDRLSTIDQQAIA